MKPILRAVLLLLAGATLGRPSEAQAQTTPGTPAPCATPGKDGNAGALSGVVNTYFAGTASAVAGSTSVQVGASSGASTGITAGDLLLVIQMQAADINSTNDTNYGANNGTGAGNLTNANFKAGTYEYVTATGTLAAGTAGPINVTTLVNGYATAAATATTARRSFQVVRIPQYSTVTLAGQLNAMAWNGSTGGILAMDVAGNLNVNGQTLNAAGLGFRGGAGVKAAGTNAAGFANTDYRTASGQPLNGSKGEGTAGTPRYTFLSLAAARTDNTTNTAAFAAGVTDGYPNGDNAKGAPGNAGGGATDDLPTNNGINPGGAGGANGGAGGIGGYPRANTTNNLVNMANQAIGGAAFGAVTTSRVVMGGGGGAGTTNDGNGDAGLTGIYSSGAPGGGVILVRTGSVSGTGTLNASGFGGFLIDASGTGTNDGAGGGGAGGTVLVTANTTAGLANLTLLANGGAGSSNKNSGDVAHGPGGGGSGGVLFANAGVNAGSSAAGGSAGTIVSSDQYTGTSYGAGPGAAGVVNTSISTSIANSAAGASCMADVATTITGPANANAGSTVTLTPTFSNLGNLTAASVTRTVSLPAGVTNVVATGGTITGTVATGYTVTYPTLPTLAPGAANTFAITYTAPASGTVMATANTATTTNEGGRTANNTSSLTTTVGLIADVTTELTGPTTLSPGQPTGTYTASFTNEGPSIASSVTRQVTLPAGATNLFVNGVAYTPVVANTIDFGTAATLASGASTAFTFSFTPAATATGSLAITSTVTTTTSQGSNAAPDASTINATVPPTADVVATIAAGAVSTPAGTLASAGTPPSFTVTFANNGPGAASGVAAAVQLPAGLTNVLATNGGTYNAATGVVTYTIASPLASGSTTSSKITFDAPTTGAVVASATVSTTTNEAGRTANNQASAAISTTPAFDLTTAITGPASAVAGNLVTLAVTTTNNGPSAAANAVQAVQLVSGLSNVYVSNGGAYNPAPTTQTFVLNGVSYAVPAGGVIFPALASLPSGQTVANSVSFSQPATAFAPSATVTPNTGAGGETNPANNTAYLNGAATSTALTIPSTVPPGSPNAYTKISSSVPSTTVGGPVTLTVITGNNGPVSATGVTQTVQILPGFAAAGLQVNGSTGTLSGNVITFPGGATYSTLTGVVTFPALATGTTGSPVAGSTSGTSVSNTITFSAPASTGSNGQLLALAAVSTSNSDPVPADNAASVAVTLVQTAEVATTITGPTTAAAGQPVQYTATFTNNGPMAATGLSETAQLPTGLPTTGPGAVTITDAAGAAVTGAVYNASTGLVTFPTLAADPNGATQVYQLTFAAPALSFAPRSSVNTTSADAVPVNNTASVATAVTPSADLATTVAGPATAVVGNAVTYTATTANNGPSPAVNVVSTLQLAPGFTPTTLQVNGTTGTISGTTITFGTGGPTYNTTTGLVTFPTLASLPSGAVVSNYATFVMPNAAGGQLTGVSAATSATADPLAANNTASVATGVAPTTTAVVDLTATLTSSGASAAPGAPVTFTATYGNSGPDAAVNVVPTLQLAPSATAPVVAGQSGGAPTGGIVPYANGATFNTQTGLLTFPTIASQANGASVSYAVQVLAPAVDPLQATAATTSQTSEPNTAAAQANGVARAQVSITPLFDVVTSLSGPATALPGTPQTYTVTTTNNGPSPTANASNTATTQTVTLPAGIVPTNITNGGVYSSAANTITWTIPVGQAAGSNGAVANSFTLTQPAGGVTLTASVAAPGDSNPNNNTASLTTTASNQPPLAFAVVNAAQNQNSPLDNTANVPLAISPLQASDPENVLSGTVPFTVVTIPPAAQGVLYYNNGTTNVVITAGQTLTAAQAMSLRFQPKNGFVGNAAFTYLATDNGGNPSPVAPYTIAVAPDQNTFYTLTPPKGGNANKYAAGDVLAYGLNPNAARYNSAGLVYNPASGGTPATGTGTPINGLLVSKISPVDSTTLATYGIRFTRATGLFTVFNPALLPRAGATLPAIAVTSVGLNGGVSANAVTLTTGAYPLPVELTAFAATAKNLDAQLLWRTASEKNNDHFDVERSLDGTDFVKIAEVRGQGSSSHATDYARTDAGIGAKATGLVYYRLQQVDADGTRSYSPVRTVRFGKVLPAIALFPNPATAATTLDLTALPAGAYQVSVLDATGRVVLFTTLEAGLAHPLPLNTLASGSYMLLVRGNNAGQVVNLSKRLTKE